MAVKHFNQQNFTFIVNGDAITFYCSTTRTRNGFCHHVYTCGKGKDFEHTRISYYNRTWERFEYETALYSAAEKFSKSDRCAIRLEIDNIGRAECEKVQLFWAAFKANYNALSDEQKKFVRDHTPQIGTSNQARAVAAGVGVMAALNTLQA